MLEDDADDYRLIAGQLRNQCCIFEIDWTESLAATIEKLDKNNYDVVLSDLSVSDSFGADTVKQVRQHCGTTPLIAFTSLDDDTVESGILNCGAQDYLIKGELGGRGVARAILHAVQRQETLNRINALVEELEQSQHLLERKNCRLQKLYKTAQEFVDNVSHDFRTPLTVISDYVTIIREGMVGAVNDEQKMMLDKVSVRADDLNNMVDDLLDASKLESGLLGAWRRDVDVYDIIERAQSLLTQRAQLRNVQITVACDDGLPSVYCDAEKVGRVITNLAINAIKYSGENGQVRIWAQADLAGNQVVIGITDNGPGIDDQALETIFQRFQQLNDHSLAAVKGFGLGLSIARQLCCINLGELNVESKVDEGSTFSFTLPIADPTEVMRRWLKSRHPEADLLQTIEVAIGDDVDANNADEFGSFLNCLLRRDDLLFRISSTSWLLVQAVPPSESDCWFGRVEKEFTKVNRNRPFGPLPKYAIAIHHSWQRSVDRATVLDDFDTAYRTLSGNLATV
jgi:hypothetical protein